MQNVWRFILLYGVEFIELTEEQFKLLLTRFNTNGDIPNPISKSIFVFHCTHKAQWHNARYMLGLHIVAPCNIEFPTLAAPVVFAPENKEFL